MKKTTWEPNISMPNNLHIKGLLKNFIKIIYRCLDQKYTKKLENVKYL